MPRLPPHPCNRPGCPALTHARFCERCGKAERARFDRERGTAASRGYDARWRKRRAIYLGAHPLCRHCAAKGRTTAATVVDHITPHRGDQTLFWDQENWQPLCKPCHDSKTAREVGLGGG